MSHFHPLEVVGCDSETQLPGEYVVVIHIQNLLSWPHSETGGKLNPTICVWLIFGKNAST